MLTELQRKTEDTSHEQRVENEPTEQDKYKNDDFLEHQSQLLQRNNKTESQIEREYKERLHSPISMAEIQTEGIKRNQNVEMEVVVKKQGLSEQYKLELENQTLVHVHMFFTLFKNLYLFYLNKNPHLTDDI